MSPRADPGLRASQILRERPHTRRLSAICHREQIEKIPDQSSAPRDWGIQLMEHQWGLRISGVGFLIDSERSQNN
jgi:hypothetical protein